MQNYKGLCYKNLKNDKRNTGFVFITIVLVIAVIISTLIVTTLIGLIPIKIMRDRSVADRIRE